MRTTLATRVPLEGPQGGKLESQSDEKDNKSLASDRVARHITLSTNRGLVTELELVGAPAGDIYLIRYRNASEGASKLFDSGSWIGFRYHDAHWSFVKQKSLGRENRPIFPPPFLPSPLLTPPLIR